MTRSGVIEEEGLEAQLDHVQVEVRYVVLLKRGVEGVDGVRPDPFHQRRSHLASPDTLDAQVRKPEINVIRNTSNF